MRNKDWSERGIRAAFGILVLSDRHQTCLKTTDENWCAYSWLLFPLVGWLGGRQPVTGIVYLHLSPNYQHKNRHNFKISKICKNSWVCGVFFSTSLLLCFLLSISGFHAILILWAHQAIAIARTIDDYLSPQAITYFRFFIFFEVCLQPVLHPYHVKKQRGKVLVFGGLREPIP